MRKRGIRYKPKKKSKQIQIELTEEEKKIYGNRCPPNYKKIKILGK